VLQKRTTSTSLKRHTVEHLANVTGSFAYTRGVLRELERQVRDEVARLGGNRMLEAILGKLGVPEAPPEREENREGGRSGNGEEGGGNGELQK
jgi:geranylgeranyl diphosphate synthase type 3